MDEELARAILGQLRRLGEAFNQLSELSQQITDDAARAAFRRTLGHMMADSDIHLIRPIERRYPHLEGIAVNKI